MRLKNILIVFILVAVCVLQFSDFARADGPFVMSYLGGFKPLEKTNVRLVEQYTTITLKPEGYDLVAKFKYFNPKGLETINVGFPERKHESAPDGPKSLQTRFNDKAVSVTSGSWKCTAKEDFDEPICERMWQTKIVFKGKGFTEAELIYQGDYSPDSSITGYSVFYNYSTDGQWAGKVEKLAFEIKFDDYNFPAFRVLHWTTPLWGWGIVTSSTSMEDANTEAKGYIFQPVEYERKLNSMRWTLKNYKPLNSDYFWIGLESKYTLEEFRKIKAARSNDNPEVFADVGLNQTYPYGVILGTTQDDALSQKIKNGYKESLWLRKELRQ